jgi:hypothetical protein
MTRLLGPVLVAALSLSAAPAQARVSAPQPVSPRGLLVQQSAVAAAGGRIAVLMAGDLPAARPRDFPLLARLGDVTGLGRLQRLAGDVSGPRVAVGADGTAVAAWTAHPRRATTVLRVAIARPGHNFGQVQTLSQARSVKLGGVGVTATGRAVITWRPGTSGTPVQVAVAAPGHRFGAAQTLGVSRSYAPALTVAPSGTVVVAWLDTPSPPKPPPAPPQAGTAARVLAATLTAGAARFGRATELSTLGYWFYGPDAASGPGGAAVTWRQTPIEKRLVSLTDANALQPAVPLPSFGYSVENGDHLALGIPAGGTTVALWREVRTRTAEDPALTYAAVKSSVQEPGGAFSPAETLSPSGWIAGPPQAGALTDRTVAAWSESRRARRPRLRIAVRRVGQGWALLPPLPAGAIDPFTVRAAASPRYAVVAWVQDVGTPGRAGACT